MFNTRKQYVKDALKLIARREGISVREVRENMQATIEEEQFSDDPQVREHFERLFGKKTPTPEEYIYTLSKQTGKVRF